MKKPQWIVASVALLLTIALYALTQNNVFGHHPKKPTSIAVKESHEGHNHDNNNSTDTILNHAKESLSPEQITRINFLENSISGFIR